MEDITNTCNTIGTYGQIRLDVFTMNYNYKKRINKCPSYHSLLHTTSGCLSGLSWNEIVKSAIQKPVNTKKCEPEIVPHAAKVLDGLISMLR